MMLPKTATIGVEPPLLSRATATPKGFSVFHKTALRLSLGRPGKGRHGALAKHAWRLGERSIAWLPRSGAPQEVPLGCGSPGGLLSRLIVYGLFSLLLAGCFQQRLPDLSNLPDAPSDFPIDKYQRLVADGWTNWTLDPAQTLVQLKVYKDGRLARLGHNHIISATQVLGRVAINGEQLQADLYVRLDQLEVDQQSLRTAAGAGFESRPDPEDVSGTRANMLSDKVMSATTYPFAQAAVSGNFAGVDGLTLALTLHGQTQTLVVPISATKTGGNLTVSGSISDLPLSSFGVPKFAILGGAIGVADAVDLSFQISASLN